MRNSERVLDGSAIGLSGLCLIHCLLLPIVAALLPVFGAWARAEWVHVVFVFVAAPLSALALLRQVSDGKSQRPVILLAAAGVGLLSIGAFVVPATALDAPVTVAGSLCLASAHIWNWRRRQASHAGHNH